MNWRTRASLWKMRHNFYHSINAFGKFVRFHSKRPQVFAQAAVAIAGTVDGCVEQIFVRNWFKILCPHLQLFVFFFLLPIAFEHVQWRHLFPYAFTVTVLPDFTIMMLKTFCQTIFQYPNCRYHSQSTHYTKCCKLLLAHSQSGG